MESEVKNIDSVVKNMDSASADTGMKQRGGEISPQKTSNGTTCKKDTCKNCLEYFSDFNRFMSATVKYLCSNCGTKFVPPGIAASESMIDKITKQTTQDVPESRHPPPVPYNVRSHNDVPVQRTPAPQISVKERDLSDEDENNDDYDACVDLTIDDDNDSDRAPVLKSPKDPVVGVKTFIIGAVSSTPIVTTSKKGKPLVRLSVPNTCKDRKSINGNVPTKQELKGATVQSFSNLIKSNDVTKFYVRVESAPKPHQNNSRPAVHVKEGMTYISEGDHGPGSESGGSSQVVLHKDTGQPENYVVSDTGNPGQPKYKDKPDGKSDKKFKLRVLLKDAGQPEKRAVSDTGISGMTLLTECTNQREGYSGRNAEHVLFQDIGHTETCVSADTSISSRQECKNQPEGQSVIRSELKVLLKDIRHTWTVSGTSMPDITECKSKPEREHGGSSKQGLPEDTSDTEDCLLSDIGMPDIRECKYRTEREPGNSSEQGLPEDRVNTEESVMSDTSMPDITEYKYLPEGGPGGSPEQVLSDDTSDTEECVMSDTGMPDITDCANQLEREHGGSLEEVLLKDKGHAEKCLVSDRSITCRSEGNTELKSESGHSSEHGLPKNTSSTKECPLPSNFYSVTVDMFGDTVATKESSKAEKEKNAGGGVFEFEDTEHNENSHCFTSDKPEIVAVGSAVHNLVEHTGHLENSSLCINDTVRNFEKESAPDVVENTETIEISDLKSQKPVQVSSETHLSVVTGITDSDYADRPMQVITDERPVESTVADMKLNVYEVVKREKKDKRFSCSESDNFMDTLETLSEELDTKTQSGSVDHSYSHQSKKTPVVRVTKFPRQKSKYKMTSATKVYCSLCRKTFPSSSTCFAHVRKVHFLIGTHLNIKQRRISQTRMKLCVESEQVKTSRVTEEVSQELPSQLTPEAYLDDELVAKLTEAEELRNKFICGICKEGFMDIELMNQHSQIQHQGELANVIEVQRGHVCEFCGKEEETKAKLQEHYKKHKNYFIVCELCKEEFRTISDVRWHVKTVHPTEKFVSVIKKKKTFKCYVCGKKVTSKTNLTQHMRIHTGESPYACDICGKRAKTKGQILQHKRANHPTEEDKIAKANQPTFACTVCHKEVKSKRSLEQHMRLHTGEKPFQCGACGMCFSSGPSVYGHIRRVHKTEKPKPRKKTFVTCKLCGKQVTTNRSLRQHMLTHTGERPHACPHCDQRFRAISALKAHVRRHEGKQFKCDECGEAFNERYQLKQHMNGHNGRSEQCSYCGKVFYDTYVFKKHVRSVHERGDKYQCNLCNKTLSSGYSLKEHMNVHSGNRPYSCKICSQTFKSSSACRAHEKRHSIVGNVYECPKCSKGFRIKYSFQKHVLRNNCNQDTGSKTKATEPVKKFQCVYCEKAYFSEEKFRKHVARHVVESSSEEDAPTVTGSGKSILKTKVYSCSQCDKQYKTAGGLRKHKKIHEKEEEEEEEVHESEDERTPSFIDESRSSRKIYECGHCGKEYKNKKSLKKHEQKHVEELSSENENDKGNVEEESILDYWNI